MTTPQKTLHCKQILDSLKSFWGTQCYKARIKVALCDEECVFPLDSSVVSLLMVIIIFREKLPDVLALPLVWIQTTHQRLNPDYFPSQWVDVRFKRRVINDTPVLNTVARKAQDLTVHFFNLLSKIWTLHIKWCGCLDQAPLWVWHLWFWVLNEPHMLHVENRKSRQNAPMRGASTNQLTSLKMPLCTFTVLFPLRPFKKKILTSMSVTVLDVTEDLLTLPCEIEKVGEFAARSVWSGWGDLGEFTRGKGEVDGVSLGERRGERVPISMANSSVQATPQLWR